jgi:hypothetical protein
MIVLCASHFSCIESGRGLPHSKTLARIFTAHGWREASWSAAVLCRSGAGARHPRKLTGRVGDCTKSGMRTIVLKAPELPSALRSMSISKRRTDWKMGLQICGVGGKSQKRSTLFVGKKTNGKSQLMFQQEDHKQSNERMCEDAHRKRRCFICGSRRS